MYTQYDTIDNKTRNWFGNAYSSPYLISKDNEHIYYIYNYNNPKSRAEQRFVEIQNADVSSFIIISENYAKDKNKVYFREKVIENANPKTFSLFEDQDLTIFSKDGKKVFVEDKEIPDADSRTFRKIGSCYFSDQKYIYSSTALKKLKGVNAQSFEIINEEFLVSNGVVYHMDSMVQVDPYTFTEIPHPYYKDKNQVFYYDLFTTHTYVKINEADRATFKPLPQNNNNSFSFIETPYIDKNNIYIFGKKIEGADPSNYVTMGKYIITNNQVYYIDKQLPQADAKTFSYIGDGYSRDKNHVYYCEKTVQSADPKTFQIVDNLRMDNNYLFFQAEIITQIDKHSFQKMSDFETIFIDKDYVYAFTYGYYVIEKRKVQRDNFKKIADQLYKDNNYLFYTQERRIDTCRIDGATLVYLDKGYLKDKDRAYYYNKPIEKSDSKSFTYLAYDYAKDKSRMYYEGKYIENANPDYFTIISTYLSYDNKNLYYQNYRVEEIETLGFRHLGSKYYIDNQHLLILNQQGDFNKYKLKDLNIHPNEIKYLGNNLFKCKNKEYTWEELINTGCIN